MWSLFDDSYRVHILLLQQFLRKQHKSTSTQMARTHYCFRPDDRFLSPWHLHEAPQVMCNCKWNVMLLYVCAEMALIYIFYFFHSMSLFDFSFMVIYFHFQMCHWVCPFINTHHTWRKLSPSLPGNTLECLSRNTIHS